ncbi:MAG: NADH:flavin oxidoreductase [Planctomycetes bacterium]|nr:NADH:flavin oxidoreductase [Planctomycetota bacterium]
MKLFSPLPLRSRTLPNRIVVPAMVTRLSGEDGCVNDGIRERYARFAKGGAGLVVVEAMAVHQAKSGPLLRIGGNEFVPGLRSLAQAMHDAGPGLAFPQIIHFLKISRSGWRQKVSDLTIDEVRAIPGLYAAAATRALEAGFDGVELHMAHAYTLSSFLSRLNSRRDEYGGSLERRLRLPLETVAAVRAAVGEAVPVGLRFDGEECVKGGYTLEDSRVIALRLAQAGVDYISVSAGGKFEDAMPREGQPLYPYTGYSGERCMPGRTYQPAANAYLAAGIRAFLRSYGVQTPVAAAGKINTPDLAESLLQREEADLIAMARPLLADPDWPRKVQAGRWGNVIRCCYANVCKAKDEHFQTVTCFLWPKGATQAPESTDEAPPRWPKGGAVLSAQAADGRIQLRWSPAEDPEGVYGYDIWRNGERIDAVPSAVTMYHDGAAVSGIRYTYWVEAYDMGGNRSGATNQVEIELSSQLEA